MRLNKVSTRYAKAIFDSYKGEKTVRTVISELGQFADCMDKVKDLQIALTTPLVPSEKRIHVVTDVAKKLDLSKETIDVLKVLSEARRFAAIRGIAEALNLIVMEAAHVVPLKVECTEDLDASEKKKVEGRFEKILGKKVEASYSLNPELVGGLRVTAAGRTYDGSVVGWLNAMEENVVGGNL